MKSKMQEVRANNLKLWFSKNAIPPKEKSYISQLINMKSSFGEKSARRLEKDYGMPDLYLDSQKENKSNAEIMGAVSEWDSHTPLNNDEVEVPFFKDIHLSAGNGFFDDIQDYEGRTLRIAKSTLKSNGVDKDCSVFLSVEGDSMEPVFSDGSTVNINMGDTRVKDGKIYAINHDGLLRIKILENLPANQIKIKSYNPLYKDEIVSNDQLIILGRVWWQCSIIK